MTIDVFPAEREAGLEDLIKANASIALLADVTIAEPFEVSETAKAYFLATAENKGQIDLHYIKTVMVSTGWNKNDDVFDAVEMWEARHSPEDKPFNFEHNQADIIGHITGSQVVDADMRPIPETTPASELPDPYHIVTTAVLYKIWEDPERQARMDRLIAEIARGGWFVSMEALFHGFDYSIKTEKGRRIVARNEKTAFLTKHLRAYGGDGTYEGAQIGRVLRKIVFSGKGLVKKPANPDSVILESANASGYELPREESLTMSEEIKTAAEAEVAAANERAAKLEAELAAAAAELNTLKVAQRQAALKATAAESLGEGSDVVAEALASLTDEQFSAALAAVNDYLAAKLAAYKEAEQRAQTAESLKAAVEDMKSVLQQIKEAVNKEEKEEEAEAEANTSVKKMALPKKAPPPEAANVVTGGILNNVIPSEEPALADPAVDQSVNKVAAQIAAFFGADETEEPAAE